MVNQHTYTAWQEMLVCCHCCRCSSSCSLLPASVMLSHTHPPLSCTPPLPPSPLSPASAAHLHHQPGAVCAPPAAVRLAHSRGDNTTGETAATCTPLLATGRHTQHQHIALTPIQQQQQQLSSELSPFTSPPSLPALTPQLFHSRLRSPQTPPKHTHTVDS